MCVRVLSARTKWSQLLFGASLRVMSFWSRDDTNPHQSWPRDKRPTILHPAVIVHPHVGCLSPDGCRRAPMTPGARWLGVLVSGWNMNAAAERMRLFGSQYGSHKAADCVGLMIRFSNYGIYHRGRMGLNVPWSVFSAWSTDCCFMSSQRNSLCLGFEPAHTPLCQRSGEQNHSV